MFFSPQLSDFFRDKYSILDHFQGHRRFPGYQAGPLNRLFREFQVAQSVPDSQCYRRQDDPEDQDDLEIHDNQEGLKKHKNMKYRLKGMLTWLTMSSYPYLAWNSR